MKIFIILKSIIILNITALTSIIIVLIVLVLEMNLINIDKKSKFTEYYLPGIKFKLWDSLLYYMFISGTDKDYFYIS